MTLEIILRLIAGLILLLANAFFVATEFALTRLRQYERDDLEKSKGIDKAWEMTETLEIYLTSCQIGITTTSILLGVMTEPAVTVLIESMFGVESIGTVSTHAISITLSVVLINLAHTVWGEQAPTYLGIERAVGVAKYSAVPHYWWTKLIYPVLAFGDYLTKATLKIFGIEIERSWLEESEMGSKGDMRSEMIDLLKAEGIPEDRRSEIIKAYEIGETPVEEIMVPRDEIVYCSTKNSFEENLDIMKKNMHTRYPLVGSTLDDFKGILYSPEILSNIEFLQKGENELDDIDWPKLTVDRKTPVSELIDTFQEEQHELALVMNGEHVEGLVTLTDALEAIVGSSEDPLDLVDDEDDIKHS